MRQIRQNMCRYHVAFHVLHMGRGGTVGNGSLNGTQVVCLHWTYHVKRVTFVLFCTVLIELFSGTLGMQWDERVWTSLDTLVSIRVPHVRMYGGRPVLAW